MSPSVDIVVPVLNEAPCVDELCDRVAALGLFEGLIFVDNGSTDDTIARIQRRGARLVRHERDLGWGTSIRDGIAAGDAELIVLIDADLEYPPEAIPRLLEALRRHPVVYASRFLEPEPPAMSRIRVLGNRVMSGVFNLLFRQRTTDLCTGLRGVRRSALPLERLRCAGWENVAELGAMATEAGVRIAEVPVRYEPRDRGESKMRHVPVALGLVLHMLRFRLRGTGGVDRRARAA
ncbi:MAG: glycosyltransferase family 2 protein [bacterium]|nr:glycosyltransferase family 2 protein [bacterium]